jgi:hypothetical protein
MRKIMYSIPILFCIITCEGVGYLINGQTIERLNCPNNDFQIIVFESRKIEDLDKYPVKMNFRYSNGKLIDLKEEISYDDSDLYFKEYIGLFGGSLGSVKTFHRTTINCLNSKKVAYDSGILHIRDMACYIENNIFLYLEGIPKKDTDKYCPRRRYEESEN